MSNSRRELNEAAVKFYATCQSLISQSRDVEAWDSISALLEIVHQENIFEVEGAPLLKENVVLGLQGLSGEDLEMTRAIARCLACLTRVDYDLILPAMGDLFAHILTVSRVHPDHLFLLDILLEYHTKTRTVNQYIEVLISTLSNSALPTPVPVIQRYTVSHSSPLLHPSHLEKVAKATQQFLTPSQTDSTVERICQVMKTLQEHYKNAKRQSNANHGKSSRKSRKSDAMDIDDLDPSDCALACSLFSNLAQVVLGHLPIASLPQQHAAQVKSTVAEFYRELVENHLLKQLKGLSKVGDEESDAKEGRKRRAVDEAKPWGVQVVVVSLLRLKYALETSTYIQLSSTEDAEMTTTLLSILGQRKDALLPELLLETVGDDIVCTLDFCLTVCHQFRALLHQSLFMEKSEVHETIDFMLKFLEGNLVPDAHIIWSGKTHELSFGENGRIRAAVALLHIVLERWLPVFE